MNEGDLLFARSGATVGKTYQYKIKDGLAIFAGYLIRFKTDEKKVLSDYIFHYTKTKVYENWVLSKQKVVAQPNINAKQYGTELIIPIPPLELQRKFSKIVERVESLRNEKLKSAIQIENLFQSLQQRAFKGELFNDKFTSSQPQEEKVWQQTSLF